MPGQYEQAGELDEAEEVLDVEFPSSDKPAVVLHPGEDAFALPFAPVASKGASILGPSLSVHPVG